MAEVAVRGDLEVEVVPAPDPLRPLDDADEDVVLRLRGREGPEVVLAGQSGRRSGQGILVERARVPPAPAHLERRRRHAREQPVAIAARARGVTGVEARRRLGGREHGDLLREAWVERDRKSTRLNSSHLVISYAVF